jgi:hypothetical protein
LKFLTLLLIFLALNLETTAQAPAIDSTWLPVQGSNYYHYKISRPPHGRISDTGANIVWDYSDSINLKQFPDDTSMFVLPATRNISCTNSASNLAKGTASFHHCYIKNDYGLYETGSVQNIIEGVNYHNTVFFTFTKPALLIKSDFHFNDIATDTSHYLYNYVKDPADSNYRTVDIKKMKYDGYGTLKFGGLTYDNTVRVHTYTFSVDT